LRIKYQGPHKKVKITPKRNLRVIMVIV
jgi:hypothetical protein